MDEIEALSQSLGQLLLNKQWTVTTAESCTGGGISAAITEVAGSSGYFERSFITYSNTAKTELVGVPSEDIEQYGAVSEEVVRAMANGALSKANANVAIAVSGIAGPGGGTETKPVGTVYLAVAIQCLLDGKQQKRVDVSRLSLSGSRKEIRLNTIKLSLIKVLGLISEKK